MTTSILENSAPPKIPPLANGEDSGTSVTSSSNEDDSSKMAPKNLKFPPKTSIPPPLVGRSYSDRRYNQNGKHRTHSTGNGHAGTAGRSSTPDLGYRSRSSRSSKRSLYASFKFIDDYSPLATKKSVDEKESSKEKNRPPPLTSAGVTIGGLQEQQQFQATPTSQQNYVRKISMIRPSIDSAAVSLDVQCGIGPYRPSCLQKFADKNWMLFWLCWFCAVQVSSEWVLEMLFWGMKNVCLFFSFVGHASLGPRAIRPKHD